jgi:dipeptidyl aminopeptidase/acylaminoacyl peptidase
MKKYFLFIVLLIASFSYSQKRAFEIEDLYRLKSIRDISLSNQNDKISYTLTSYNLKEGKSNSDIYLMNLKDRSIKQLTQFKGADFQARFSPDGNSLFFISTRSGSTQIYKLPLDGGEPVQLTHISTGVSDLVISPTGKYIAFTTKVFPECGDNDDCNKKINENLEKGPIQAVLADELLFRHWDEYSEGRRSHIFILNTETKEIKDVTPGDFDSPIFSLGGMTNYDFSPDEKELCFASNRDKSSSISQAITTNSDLLIVNLQTLETKNITQSNLAWDGSPRYSPDGRYIAYRCQSKPGYESDLFQLALYDRVKQTSKIISVGFDNWINDFQWSANSKSIYFTAEEKGGTPIYKIEIESQKITKILEANAIDDFTVNKNEDKIYLIRRSTGEPSALYEYDMKSKKLTRLTFDNKQIEDEVDICPAESYWATSKDGTKIHYFLVKPHNFDPNKKYPVILNVHGGPQSQWMDAFRGDWQVYPGKGYIVVFPNPRGSTGYGQKFTEEISKDWGGKVFEDLMAVMDDVEKFPFVDKNRVGAMGWSYGGYMMNWFQAKTDRFKCLVSMMGVYDLRSMYSSTEELWFPEWDLGGTPWESKEIYEKFSPSNYVENFKTPTLIITGERDYRVSYNQGLMYFTDLQRRGIPSRIIIFKNDGHWPNFVKSMPLYYNAHLEWFHKYLGGEPAPWDSKKMVRNMYLIENGD